MCKVLKVKIHPIHSDCLVITEDMEDLDINDISEISTAPLTFKEINGEIYELTPEVFLNKHNITLLYQKS